MRTRSIRSKRQRRGKKDLFELDITSLLDILVILLVFLLKSYSSSGIIINVPEGITLPDSVSKLNNTPGVMIQVSSDKIWVDDQEVLSAEVNKLEGRRVYDHGGRRIIPLFDALVEKKKQIDLIADTSVNAKPFSGIANFIIDKSLKYSYLKKLMYTCAEAGYKEYKFIVMGQE